MEPAINNVYDIQFAQLKRVDIRTIWKGETTDFTPWLAQENNLNVLGDAIGVSLELVGTEQYAGVYRADIVCTDVATGRYVVIENQLEQTNHTHLGQSIVYAAALDASIVVWVAPDFTREHRLALEWLSNVTMSSIQFYGVEIGLWMIGDSKPALSFNVVTTAENRITSRPTFPLPLRGKYHANRDELKELLTGNPLLSQRDIAKHFGISGSTSNDWINRLKRGE